MTDQSTQLETQLSNLVAQHAEWLTASTWMELAERVARAHFDDVPLVLDAEAFDLALRKRLAECGPATFETEA